MHVHIIYKMLATGYYLPMAFTLEELRAKMHTPLEPESWLKEFKPRKAKFGFKVDDVELAHVPELARLLGFLKAAPLSEYTIEFGVPYRGRTTVFKLYVNSDEVAAGVRESFGSSTI